MSASLVGSEMCIRDRSCTPQSWTFREGLSPLFLVLAALPPHMLHICAGAVSYTHLTLPTICSV
eukprot:2269681-Alexandrium_andersonii.AAC.1